MYFPAAYWKWITVNRYPFGRLLIQVCPRSCRATQEDPREFEPERDVADLPPTNLNKGVRYCALIMRSMHEEIRALRCNWKNLDELHLCISIHIEGMSWF